MEGGGGSDTLRLSSLTSGAEVLQAASAVPQGGGEDPPGAPGAIHLLVTASF